MSPAVDKARLLAAGIPEADAEHLLRWQNDPSFTFFQLDIEEQKNQTHKASVQAAMDFARNPRAYLDHDGNPDPMRAFYELGHLSHTRDLPGFALMVIAAGVLDLDTAQSLALFAWRAPEWPEGANTDVWRAAWTRLGFCSDDDELPPPAQPAVVYRGAIPRFKRGMAWTGDLDRARWFARRFSPDPETTDGFFRRGRVYEATVTPQRVFARIVHRGEDEWVIDTRGLPIRTKETL